MMTKNGKTYLISVVLLFVVITMATAYITIKQQNPVSGSRSESLIIQKQFVCSMHPEIIKDAPGDCPICGMSLIEKLAQDNNSADSLLTDVVRSVNESILATVGTVNPLEESLPVMIETFGTVNYDPRNIHTVSARFKGLVERSFVKYQFQPIHKGQKIFEVYCPEIYAEGWKYIRLIQSYPDRDDLTVEAMDWFKLLGLTHGQIDSLKRAAKPDYHLNVYSEAEGYAVRADFDPETYLSSGIRDENKPEGIQADRGNIGFNDGLTIETGDPLFKIINLKSLRADLKVRSEDVGLLKRGQKVIFTDESTHQRKFDAIISQVEPLNGGLFQLVKVYFKDQEGLMKPGRQINGQIMLGDYQSLWLPRSSIFNRGQHQSVFVMNNGRFIETAIKTGLRSGDKIEVLDGIDKQSEIALSALLLTDSDGFVQSGQQ